MRFALALVLAFVVSLNLSAQKNKRPDYKLLWKISGNGLARPSYLFGTMHAQDKRAFDLNDSVIAKVIQCEAFAMEVHPDSITQFMASILLDDDKGQTIESQMTPKEFKYYDSLLVKKTGISLKKFSTIKQAKYFFEQRSIKKDKNTFLDAWLYNIARENGKVMAGLENISAQTKLLQDKDSAELESFKKFVTSDTQVDNAMESLFHVYYEGDVEAIYRFSKSVTPEDRFKKMIIDRNINMTDNIVKEIHKHTIFMAVGAAHLGGEPGIVNLLRQKGYTVTPVNAPFSGTASKYKSTGASSSAEWVSFSSEEGGYSVELPQKPMPFEQPGVPVKFQMYLDIGTLTIYMVAQVPLGGVVEGAEVSKTLDRMVANMSASQKVSNVKKITMDGHEGRELETSKGGHTFRVKVTISQSNSYMLMVGSTKESANSADAKRFLSSLKVTKPVGLPIEYLESREGAFAVDMPAKVTKQVTDPIDPGSGKPFKIHVFYSTDNVTGSGYIVRYNDFPVGYVSTSDSIYIHSTLQSISGKMPGAHLTTNKVDFHGYPSTHFTLYPDDSPGMIEGVLTLRGERFYMLMKTISKDDQAKKSANAEKDRHDFFDSFTFNTFDPPKLKEVTFPEGFALKVPITFEADSTVEREASGDNRYSFIDRNSGMMFMIVLESFSKYDQVESVDKFFSSVKDELLPANGLVFAKDSSIVDKVPTHEYVYQLKNDNSIVKVRSAVAGMTMVSLWAYMPANDHDLAGADQIFDSFKVTPKSDWSLFTDKSDLILSGLLSADSTERAQAKSALENYTFKEPQLPAVYEAIKKKYHDDGQWYSSKGLLIEALERTHDKTTQSFIEEFYPAINDTTDISDRALSVLNSLKTAESVKKATALLVADKSDHRFNSRTILNSLRDSLELLNEVIPDFLNSISKLDNKSSLFYIMKTAIDSNAFTLERKNQIIPVITEIATKLSETSHDPNDYDLSYDRYAMLDFFSVIPFTPQLETIVRKFEADDNDDDTKLSCMQLLLKNNKEVPAADINVLASKSSMRISIYEELLQYNKVNLINKKYTTEKMLSESDIGNYLYLEETMVPDKLDFLKEKYVISNGEKKKLLVFTYGYEDTKEKTIAVAGPYPLKSKEFKRGEATGSLWEEYINEKDLNEKLATYLADFNLKLID